MAHKIIRKLLPLFQSYPVPFINADNAQYLQCSGVIPTSAIPAVFFPWSWANSLKHASADWGQTHMKYSQQHSIKYIQPSYKNHCVVILSWKLSIPQVSSIFTLWGKATIHRSFKPLVLLPWIELIISLCVAKSWVSIVTLHLITYELAPIPVTH